MARYLSFIFISFVALEICAAVIPSTIDISKAQDVINAIIDAHKVVGKKVTEFPFIAGFVRLAFHDCVGAGHCDGCINHNLPDNGGLIVYTDALDVGYESVSSTMSRADFYALASITALERATEFTTDKFTALEDGLFEVGRIDCSTSPNEDALPPNGFPDGHFDNAETLDFFEIEFQFTPQEVVALMGAHTLGRCIAPSSGFQGKWLPGKTDNHAHSDMLDNNWYRVALGNWTQVPVTFNGVTKLQWQRFDRTINAPGTSVKGQNSMFLNSDLSLVWDFAPVADDGSVECKIACTKVDKKTTTLNCCKKEQTTNSLFREYVPLEKNALWMKDFTAVFIKMINFSDATLESPTTSSADDKMAKKSSDDEVDNILTMLQDVKEDVKTLEDDLD